MFARLLWLLENSDLERVIPLISNWQSRTHTYSVRGIVCLWNHSVLVELMTLYFHSVKDSTKDLNVRSQVLTFYWCVLLITLLKIPESLSYCLKGHFPVITVILIPRPQTQGRIAGHYQVVFLFRFLQIYLSAIKHLATTHIFKMPNFSKTMPRSKDSNHFSLIGTSAPPNL